MALGDFKTALEFRDLLEKMVKAEIEKQRPAIRYATVTSIDRILRKCTVLYPGEATPVKVSMGSVQPSSIGQTVRIDGLLGDRFVADVLGPIYLDQPDLKGSVDVTGDVTATGAITGASVTGATVTSTSGKAFFGSDNDLIRHDDTTNRYHLISDGTTSDDVANAGLAAKELYYPNGASANALSNGRFFVRGGGNIDPTGSHFNWTQRFIVGLGMGRGPQWGSTGYFEINMPSDGTVITGLNGASNVTVGASTAGMIQFVSAWHTLWYELPIGQSAATVGNFYMMAYASNDFEPPPHWIPIAQRGDDSLGARWLTCVGEIDYWRSPTLLNSWANYGAGGYDDAGYRKDYGWVSLQGLVKSGTGTNAIMTLPAGFRPEASKIWATHASSGMADVRVTSSGNVYVATYYSGGTNASVSLSPIRFKAVG